ncbi:PVC-type heme-binding CxxCH protein [Humisphaera borealis]|uniref:HEAT repeat domain-containing protein n=1 Tax=Humisphaera borealis TaxID=2807512 RepID=A0A7M2X0K9_9BACT|nr:PVC-type heme-binding CxxCH protein [Humisphaera borealis]QOV91189.1 HEAT repeat domain-containing protein [Humisphaera borealis]
MAVSRWMGRGLVALVAVGLLSARSPGADAPAPQPPAPAPLAEAAGRMTVPPGFNVRLFAGEPDVVQPIAFTWDHRGRMWVVQCLSYPNWAMDDSKPGTDSIIILEDTDHDGKFDKRTVFADKLRNVSAIEVGFGGVWIGAIPYLQFIPDRDGDDKPDGPPENLLDGWNVKEVKHNIFSSFTWGPDGWLYATNGIQSKSAVGKPGTPAEKRVKFDCGVWRYHPTKHLFEVVCVGTTNPWGLDFDEYGNCFFTNCVIAHLWHAIPGAHFQRMYGQHTNPYHYGYMQSCADHLHWGGGSWTESRGGQGKHSEAGGGHAHIGAMVYQGDNWPDEYRGGLYTCNLHGNRVNHDIFEAKGSGVVAHHGKDFLLANDTWFRGLAIKSGPDGAVYICDWTDTGECHNYVVVDRMNGRLYRVAFGTPSTVPADLSKLDDTGLIKLLDHKNQWWTRTARRLLQERTATGKLGGDTVASLRKALDVTNDPKAKLRALWHLVAVDGVTPELLTQLTGDSPYVAGWAIRLAVDGGRPSDALLARFAELARSSESPVVRLNLASALQRLPVADRWAIAEGLVQHDDNEDANLPLMVWFGVEPLVSADLSRAMALAEKSKLKIVQQYIARRAVDGVSKPGMEAVVALLDKTSDQELRKWLLVGLKEGLAGLRKVDMPAAWPQVYQKLLASNRGEVREGATQVGLVFGDTLALGDLRKQATDATADPQARQRAIQSLVTAKDADLAPLLHKLLDDRDVRTTAIKAIAAVGHADSAKEIIKRYGKLTVFEKPDAVQTLVSRPAYASALLDAIEAGTVARADLTAYSVRQLANITDAGVKAKLAKVWGDVRPTDKDKQQKIKDYKKLFAADVLAKADLANGKGVYAKTCAACHTLFNEGGKVGPDLTGSQRTNLDYVLENVVDPSAQVAREFRVTIIDTKDDRTIDGIVTAENDKSVTIRTTNEEITVPVSEIRKRRQSPLSMMPEGQLDTMPEKDRVDLIGYLMK